MSDLLPKNRAINCSKCGTRIPYLGNWMRDAIASGSAITVMGGSPFSDSVSDADQWKGVVCTNCNKIFCHRCMVAAPGPCPVCGQRVVPATDAYVRSLPKENDTSCKNNVATCVKHVAFSTAYIMAAVAVVVVPLLVFRRSGSPGIASSEGAPEKLVVYTTHQLFRDHQCIQIETVTRDLLQSEFGTMLSSGKIELSAVDITRNHEFAQRYTVQEPSVILVWFTGETEITHRHLDEAWDKMLSNPVDFRHYVREAIYEEIKGHRE